MELLASMRFMNNDLYTNPKFFADHDFFSFFSLVCGSLEIRQGTSFPLPGSCSRRLLIVIPFRIGKMFSSISIGIAQDRSMVENFVMHLLSSGALTSILPLLDTLF